MSASPHDNHTAPPPLDAPLGDWALYYAVELGWPVFPVQPDDKVPHKSEEVMPGVAVPAGRGGFHLASTDPATITRWWTRWPHDLIGVALDGWCVVEADVRAGGVEALVQFCELHDIDITHTVQAVSASGGPHFYFRDVPGLRRAISFIPGVDFLASGSGFVGVAPSRRKRGQYQWKPGHAPWECAMAEMPTALREAIEQSSPKGTAYAYKSRPAGYAGTPRSRTVTDPEAYVRAALDNALDTVSTVKAGQRRDVLNSQSFALGRFVGGGYLSRTEARDGIARAFKRAGHTLDAKAEETIDVGLDDGAAQPLQLVIGHKETDAQGNDGAQHTTTEDNTPHTDEASGGILQRLRAEMAAHQETRRQLEGYLRLMRDPRLRPGQKVTTMLAWAETDGPPKNLHGVIEDDPTDDTAPPDELEQRGYNRLYITSTAEKKAGMNARVFGRTIDDVASIGLLKTQTRTEAVQVPLDPDITPPPTRNGSVPATAYKYMTAIYVKPGPLPDRSLDKKAVQTKATRRAADAARKEPRCPACGSKRLTAVAYRCESCLCTCTRDEAEHAGETIKQTNGGQWVNEHGEVLHNGKQHWGSDDLWHEDEYVVTTDDGADLGRIPTEDDDSAELAEGAPESPLYFSSPLITQERGEEKYNAPPSDIITGAGRIPTTAMMEFTEAPKHETLGDLPAPPDTFKKPCYGGCGTLTDHGYTCKACRVRTPAPPLHIQTGFATGQEARHGR